MNATHIHGTNRIEYYEKFVEGFSSTLGMLLSLGADLSMTWFPNLAFAWWMGWLFFYIILCLAAVLIRDLTWQKRSDVTVEVTVQPNGDTSN